MHPDDHDDLRPRPLASILPWRGVLACAVLVALGLLLLSVGGCATKRTPRPAPVAPISAPVVKAQAEKDRAILREADAIDALAPDAKPHTDAQRKAVADAPAADVARIVAEYEAALKALTAERDSASKRADDLAKQLDAANQKTDNLIRLGLAAAGAVCIGLGILSAFLAAKVAAIFPGLGPRISLGIGAIGAGFLFCSFAYGWALRNQTLVMSVFACAAVAVAALFYANRHHAAAPSS